MAYLVEITGIEPVVPLGGGFTVHCITIDASSPYCWCPGRDSNSQSLRQWLLRPPCLPIPPSGHTILKHTRGYATLQFQNSRMLPSVF